MITNNIFRQYSPLSQTLAYEVYFFQKASYTYILHFRLNSVDHPVCYCNIKYTLQFYKKSNIRN